jgi:hypothetical protein
MKPSSGTRGGTAPSATLTHASTSILASAGVAHMLPCRLRRRLATAGWGAVTPFRDRQFTPLPVTRDRLRGYVNVCIASLFLFPRSLAYFIFILLFHSMLRPATGLAELARLFTPSEHTSSWVVGRGLMVHNGTHSKSGIHPTPTGLSDGRVSAVPAASPRACSCPCQTDCRDQGVIDEH